MASFNKAFLFSEFIEDVKSHGLGYVCDTELYTMFPSTLGDNVATALSDIEDDIELEQWLDFVRARQFRQSLLCPEENRIDDEIDLNVFEGFSISADLKPARRPELRRDKASSFIQFDGTQIQVTHPLTKAALLYLGEVFPDAVPMQRLQQIAQDRVRNVGGHDYVTATESLTAELFSLFAHHALRLHWHPYSCQRHINDRPVVNQLGRAQAENGWSQIASVHHAGLEVDSFSARCISLMNGRLNQEQLVAKMSSEIRSGSLRHPTLDLSNWPKAKLHKQVQESCRNLVKLMARYGLLEAR
jgi:methyltransferase-like protein